MQVDVTDRQFWDFWILLFATSTTLDVRSLYRLRAVSRLFRDTVDAHASARLNLCITSDARFIEWWKAGGRSSSGPDVVSMTADKNRTFRKGCIQLPKRSRAFYERLRVEDLPRSLTCIKFPHQFNRPIADGALPPNLTQLKFGLYFEQPLDTRVLPRTLLRLKFGSLFNKPLDVANLPRGLLALNLGHHFHHPVSACDLPPSLRKLAFRDSFNLPLDIAALPRGIVVLVFGKRFNQPVDTRTLPPSVERLVFGWHFRQLVDVSGFPCALRKLKLPVVDGYPRPLVVPNMREHHTTTWRHDPARTRTTFVLETPSAT